MGTTKKKKRAPVKMQRQTRSLDQLAREINAAHHAAEGRMRDSLRCAHRAGELLLAVKSRLEHGEFLPWVAQHCTFSQSTANLYMKLGRIDSQHVGNLSLREATQLLYTPNERAGDDDAEESAPPPPWTVHQFLKALDVFHEALMKAHEHADASVEQVRQFHPMIHSRWEQVSEAYKSLDEKLRRVDAA